MINVTALTVHVPTILPRAVFFYFKPMGAAKKPNGGKGAGKAPNQALAGAAARKARQEKARRPEKKSTV